MELPCGSCTYVTPKLPESAAVAVLNSHTASHTSGSSTERRKRPTIKTEITLQDWTYFLRCWQLYKKSTNIRGDLMVCELLDCCSEELAKDIDRTHSEIDTMNEEEILTAIKERAVIIENPVVAQVTHMNMKQGAGEKIRPWAARLKGQASACEYKATVKCKCGEENTADFTDHAIRQIIAASLSDPDIQRDLLSELNTRKKPMTSDDMISFIEGRENGRESALKLSSRNTSIAAMRNPQIKYKSHKHGTQAPSTEATRHKQDKCSYCGLTGHGNHTGREGGEIRKRLGCPAVGVTCHNCKKFNHFARCCKSTQRSSPIIEESEEEQIQEDQPIMEFNTIGTIRRQHS